MSLFMFIVKNLPSAIEGYYHQKDPDQELTGSEISKLKGLLSPYRDENLFKDDQIVEYCFFCLFRSIKVKLKKYSHSYQFEKTFLESEIPVKEINKIIDNFTNPKKNLDKLDLVEFHFRNSGKVKLSGFYTDFLFQMMFSYFDKLKPTDEGIAGKDLELSGLMYFKSKYEDANKYRAGKRGYKKRMTYDEYHNAKLKGICKELHQFLKKFSYLIPKGKTTSNRELNLIKDFIELTKFHKFDYIETLRSYIVR